MKEHSTGAPHTAQPEPVNSVADALRDAIQSAREWVRGTGADMAAMVVDGKLSPLQMSAGLEEVRAFIQDVTDLTARWVGLNGRLIDTTKGHLALNSLDITPTHANPAEATHSSAFAAKKTDDLKLNHGNIAEPTADPMKEKDRFGPAISNALRILGGSGTSAQLKEVIEENKLIEFAQADFLVFRNGKTSWRLAVDRGLTSLRRDGQVAKDENKVWSLALAD